MTKKFNYTYTALTEGEKREVERIRRQYQPNEEKKGMERLTYLDKKVNNGATIPALILGIVGSLLFGLGLAMILEWGIVGWGIAVCALSALPIAAAYPVYRHLLKKYRKKYGEEILALTDQLLQAE